MQKYLLSLLAALIFCGTAQAAVKADYRVKTQEQLGNLMSALLMPKVAQINNMMQQMAKQSNQKPTVTQIQHICRISQAIFDDIYDVYDTNRPLFDKDPNFGAHLTRTQFLQKSDSRYTDIVADAAKIGCRLH